MTYEDFRASLSLDTPPPGLPALAVSLWHADKGDWHAAHAIAQEIDTSEAAWVHAHLHRVEGDLWNADYWYRRAGRTRPDGALEDEWSEIVKAMLGAANDG